MTLVLAGLAAALSLLTPSVAAAAEATFSVEVGAAARVVELRVAGDSAALARVRLTARELLLRLDVEPRIRALDEPAEVPGEPQPLVIAYLDLRNVATPSIDIEDGRTHQALTQRQLSDVSSLETGVEALLHVLYLAVESSLQLVVPAPPKAPPPPPPPQKPEAPTKPATKSPSIRFSFDAGPLLRLSSLGGTRIVPGGGLSIEPRVELGQSQLGLHVSGTFHGSSDLSAVQGVAEVRPVQFRMVPAFDWLISPEASACVGLGAGLDALLFNPILAPNGGTIAPAQSAVDPVVTGMLGARLRVSGRAFLSALASLDLDLAPTAFMARDRSGLVSVLSLPRLRGGFTLALGFTAAGARRFSKAEREP